MMSYLQEYSSDRSEIWNTKYTHNAEFYAFLQSRQIFVQLIYTEMFTKHLMSYTIMFGMISGIHF